METVMELNKLEKVAFVLKTIAHPLRIGIVELLTYNKRLSVNEICDRLNSEQSLTSHHLSIMKLKGILDSSRDGKNMYYSLRLREVTKVIGCIENCNMDNII